MLSVRPRPRDHVVARMHRLRLGDEGVEQKILAVGQPDDRPVRRMKHAHPAIERPSSERENVARA
jgi:hypothetical protein